MDFRRSVAVLPLLIMMVLSACTSGSGEEGVATVGGPPSVAASLPSGDALARELEFVACMRKAGIAMPDPLPEDKSGRSALLQAMDKGMGLKDAFHAALDTCATYLPPADKPKAPEPGDVDKLRQYAQCMRENGVKDFPDPDPATGQLHGWILEGDKTAEVAVEKCRNLLPPPSTSGPLAEPTR